MTFVIRKGREFEENDTYNELGHWGADGKWHHIDDGTLEEMEAKAHYLNGGSENLREIMSSTKDYIDSIHGRLRIVEQDLRIDPYGGDPDKGYKY